MASTPATDGSIDQHFSSDVDFDLEQAESSAESFLRSYGVDVDSTHLQKTPRRMALAWAEMLTPREFTMTTFPNEEEYDELVIVDDIPVQSVCEHHLLPFTGTATVAYLPNERIVGLSKLARVVEHFAKRPQTQERLTKQVAQCLEDALDPLAVGVVLSGVHTCMTLRGVHTPGSYTVTSTLTGNLRTDLGLRAEFLKRAGM